MQGPKRRASEEFIQNIVGILKESNLFSKCEPAALRNLLQAKACSPKGYHLQRKG